jgi:hypothetical protein
VARVEWVGQSASDADNRQANTSRLINFYREPVGGTAGHQLKSVLGTELLGTLEPSTGPTLNVRAISEIGGTMYVVSGGTLFTVTTAGVETEIGFTRDREPTYLFGAEENKVCVVCGGRYFVYDGTTLERPDTADAPFADFGSGLYLNGYVVLTEEDGDRFLWTDLADAKNFEGLNFATAESTDKAILEAKKVNGRLWLMKSDVIEVWAQVGSGANAFTRVTGGVIEVGLKAKGLATTFTGGIFWVGSDNIVYLSAGEELSPISPPAVNTAVSQGTPSHVFYYEDEGHKFCVIRFNGRPAWVYDIVTGEWHERATLTDSAWDITATGLFNGVWYCGDRKGNFFKFARNNVDGTESLIRTAVSSTLYMDGEFFSVPKLEVTGRVGEGASDTLVLGEELVTNGTFETDLSGWTDESDAGGTTAWSAGKALLTYTTDRARLVQDITTETGETYLVTATNDATATGNFLNFTLGGSTVGTLPPGTVGSLEYTATGTTTEVGLKQFSAGTALIDNVSVRKIKTVRELHCTDGRVFVESDAPDPIPAGAVWRTKGRLYRAPQIGLELSGDSGRTFAEQVTRSFGKLGEYERICRFTNLGGHYRLTARVTVSEPKDISLDAMANVEVA